MYVTRMFYKREIKLIYYAALFTLLASSLMPSSVANAGCVGGSCGAGVTLTPDSGKVGTMVVLSIAGETFSEGDYEVCWSPTAAFEQGRTTVLARGHVSEGSTAVATSFTIPEAEYGVHYIQFRQLRRVVTFQFFVKPGLKVTPASSRPNATVTVNGQGFPAETGGRLTFDGKSTNLTIITNAVGSFTTEFTIPAASSGEHELVVTTEYPMTSASTKLEVLPTANVTNDIPDVPAKETGTQANATEHDSPQPLADTTSPPRPGPITPMGHRFGLVGTQTVSFKWSGANDPSGITYTLEVADNYDFIPTGLIIKRTGLTDTNCALDIAPGTYYWRVKAVDGAGNESEWSYVPYEFVVAEFSNFMHEFTELLKKIKFFYILGFIIAGLVVIRIFVLLIRAWLRRRKGYYY
ncbi:MAG: hypothetical protein FJ005_04570 [Chloroflexi bacterium]|nr:hypothetical protein [Chloroflexota bacterium]